MTPTYTEYSGEQSRAPEYSSRAVLVLTMIYGTGMRISEAVALRVSDIDSREMTILVARGKGNWISSASHIR